MPDDVSAVTDRRYSIVMRRYPRIFSPETFGSNGPAALPLFCLAPHGVFRASRITLRAVSSYLAFSPLPALFSKNRRCLFCDTLRHRNFSTAAPAFFTRHAAVWCSDFPPANRKRSTSDHLPSTPNLSQSAKKKREPTGYEDRTDTKSQKSKWRRDVHQKDRDHHQRDD